MRGLSDGPVGVMLVARPRAVCAAPGPGNAGRPTHDRTKGDGMDAGEKASGTRDEHYDLISVLYHALQGAEACAGYARDAEASGEQELAEFFKEAQEMQASIAEGAKAMLGIGEAGGISPGGISGGVAPPS